MQMMGREHRTSPFIGLPSDAELKAFAKHKSGGPTLKDFRVDVSGKNKRSPWNRRCAKLFAAEYVKLPNAMSRNLKTVEEGFLSHVQTLCNQYKTLMADESDEDIDANDASRANVRRSRRKKVSSYIGRCTAVVDPPLFLGIVGSSSFRRSGHQ